MAEKKGPLGFGILGEEGIIGSFTKKMREGEGILSGGGPFGILGKKK